MKNNKVFLVGNLGKDPEIKDVNGTKLAKFTLATTDKWTDKQGNPQEETQWHTITAWGRWADRVEENLSRGTRIVLEGKLKYGQYDKNDGTRVYTTEVVIDSFLKVMT